MEGVQSKERRVYSEALLPHHTGYAADWLDKNATSETARLFSAGRLLVMCRTFCVGGRQKREGWMGEMCRAAVVHGSSVAALPNGVRRG